MVAPGGDNRNNDAPEGERKTDLEIMKIAVPAKIWTRKGFDCSVVVTNLAKTGGLGKIVLCRKSDGREIISENAAWGARDSAEQNREVKFVIPSGVFKHRRLREPVREDGVLSDPDDNRREQDSIVALAFSYTNSVQAEVPSSIMKSRPFKIGRIPAINFNEIDTIMVMVMAVVLVVAGLTIALEYDPRNDTIKAQDSFPIENRLVVIRHPNVIVPLKYAVPSDILDWEKGRNGTLDVIIYGNLTNADHITPFIADVSVGHSGNATLGSILTLKKTVIVVDNSTDVIPSMTYKFPFGIRHSGLVTNSAEPYTVTIVTYNSTTTQAKSHQLTFDWSIHTLDFSQVMYFWLVLAGVIFSRYVTYHSESSGSADQSTSLKALLNKGKNSNPLVWMIFSAAIALLIFAGFQDQVKNLTSSIVVNISVSFAFGFGFDKVLEATKKIQST